MAPSRLDGRSKGWVECRHEFEPVAAIVTAIPASHFSLWVWPNSDRAAQATYRFARSPARPGYRTAVCRHFLDKQALLTALAVTGAERLGDALRQAGEGIAPGRRFAELGRASVCFALSNSALFRLMFSHVSAEGDAALNEGLAARPLCEEAAALTDRGGGCGPHGLQAWALVHGLATLMVEGHVPADLALIDEIVDPATLFKAWPA